MDIERACREQFPQNKDFQVSWNDNEVDKEENQRDISNELVCQLNTLLVLSNLYTLFEDD